MPAPATRWATRAAVFAACLWLASVSGLPTAAAQGAAAQRITPNFKDADITQGIEAVAAATGKNIIVDPRVRAQVTMLSATPMTPDAFYEAFLALLQVHGFVAVPSGKTVKVIPDANARTVPGNDLPDRVSASSDELVTQVVGVRNVSAVQMVAILRPLMPQNAHLAAYPSSNMLILADRANNVNHHGCCCWRGCAKSGRIDRRTTRSGDRAGSDRRGAGWLVFRRVRAVSVRCRQAARTTTADTGIDGTVRGSTAGTERERTGVLRTN
jgi:hypothetical protein